jgi:hypothetical protein
MQTFLPYPDFKSSAQVLDYKRLGKQRQECRQILATLAGKSDSWIHHPAVLMWASYEDALREYFNAVSNEWVRRGYQHNIGFYDVSQVVYPWWLGQEIFHHSHRSQLFYKSPPNYYGWTGIEYLEYAWPLKYDKVTRTVYVTDEYKSLRIYDGNYSGTN